MAIVNALELDDRLKNPTHLVNVDELASRLVWTDVRYRVFDLGSAAVAGQIGRKLRGALGQAMVSASCDDCRSEIRCRRSPQCALHVFFGKKPTLSSPSFVGEITKPYVIWTDRHSDHDIDVTIRLFGFSCDWSNALQLLMGDVLNERIPWKKLLPHDHFMPATVKIKALGARSSQGIDISRPTFPVELEMLSPVNSERGNALDSADSLCRRLVIRAQSLARWHDCDLDVGIEGLEAEWENSDLEHDKNPLVFNFSRHSMRTDQNWNTQAQLGDLRLMELMPLSWPYLRIGEVTGIGRGATIGLGRYKLFY